MSRDKGSLQYFSDRFRTRGQVEKYRNRYATGRRARLHVREVAALKELLADLGPFATVLDIPCGTGRLAPPLADVAERVILADSSAAMLEVAREENSGLRADFLLTRAEKIDLEARSVDVAFCHRLLHHIYDATARTQMLAELRRVSRKYVILSYFPTGFRSRFRGWLRRRLGSDNNAVGPLSKRRFFNEAESAGLRFVRSTTVRKFPFAFFGLFSV